MPVAALISDLAMQSQVSGAAARAVVGAGTGAADCSAGLVEELV